MGNFSSLEIAHALLNMTNLAVSSPAAARPPTSICPSSVSALPFRNSECVLLIRGHYVGVVVGVPRGGHFFMSNY